MASPRTTNDIAALKDILDKVGGMARDGGDLKVVANNIAQGLRGVASKCTPQVGGALNQFAEALIRDTGTISVSNSFANLVKTLPAPVHANVRPEIEKLAENMYFNKLSGENNLPAAPAVQTPLHKDKPKIEPKNSKEEHEKQRREQEDQRIKELEARASWARSNMNTRIKFVRDDKPENADETSSMESGLEWKTDVKIEPGIYRIETHYKDQENFKLQVKADGTITVNNPQAVGYAMDFFAQKGAIDLVIDFQSPGPKSIDVVLKALSEADRRTGVKIEMGPSLQSFLSSKPEDSISNLNKPTFRRDIPKAMRKKINRLIDNPAVKPGWDKWINDKMLRGKSVDLFTLAGMKLEYLVEHHNQKAEQERKLGTLPSFQEAVNYKGRARSLEDTQKLATKEGSAPAKEQVFGDTFDSKNPKEKLGAVGQEMDAIQKRMASLEKELENINKGLTGDNERLAKADSKLLAHADVIDPHRSELIEQISSERKDLADRLGVCSQEIDELKKAGFTLESEEAKSLSKLEQQHKELHIPATKMEEDVVKLQQESELLSPDNVKAKLAQTGQDNNDERRLHSTRNT